MSIAVKHSFVSPKLDGPDATQVRPSNWNATHLLTGSGWMVAGQVIDFVGHTIPTDFLEAYGQSVSAATYPKLFAALVKQLSVTLTLGTPGVVNWTTHGLPVGSKVRFQTTGALPTGLTQNVDYYVVPTGYSSSAFRVAPTPGGTAIDFTGTQSGIHTGVNAQFGAANDLSTFSIPDLRGRVTAGLDSMGGTDADRLTGIAGSVNGAVLGAAGGAETAAAELPAHTHAIDAPSTALAVTVDSGGAHTHTVTGTISTVADHTHSGSGGTIGSAGSHAHAISSLVLSTIAAHAHTITVTGSVSSAGAHSHSVQVEKWNAAQSGGGHKVVQDPSETSDGAIYYDTDTHAGHTHPDTFAATSVANGSHTHTLSSGATDTEAAHTHSLSGMTIAPAGTHNHTFSSGSAASAGAHTHTASGTVNIASFTSGSAGSGTGHNNVQPTFIVRKLIFVG